MENVPKRVGPYRILEYLGEGGVGSVYLAEQAEPVRRKVAFKILKASELSPTSSWRFNKERQALARLNHHNITQVYDAGTLEDGRPYLVMEYVPGQPITHFCDERHYSIKQRIRLMIQVCSAIQHLHQKGIIHRDLKPYNILVFMQDDEPVSKVIDFGISKALDISLEGSARTVSGIIPGTPFYMSPEQINGQGGSIDTRTDIYALGILLYQLVSGELPHGADEPFYQYIHKVCIADPVPPSRKLVQTGERIQQLARDRSVSPRALVKAVNGGLDWIILKALERDREKRYSSANGLASDLQLYLNEEPILGGYTSFPHRMKSLLAKHKLSLGFIYALILGVLVYSGLTLSNLVGVNRARATVETAQLQADREAARAREITDFLQEMFTTGAPEAGRKLEVKQLLDRAAPLVEQRFGDRLEVGAVLHATLGESYFSLGFYDRAEDHLRRAVAGYDHLEGNHLEGSLKAKALYADVLYTLGRWHEVETILQGLLPQAVSVFGDTHPLVLQWQCRLGEVMIETGPLSEAGSQLKRTLSRLEEKRDHSGEFSLRFESVFIQTQTTLARILALRGRYDEAVPIYREMLAAKQRRLGQDHPESLAILGRLAALARERGLWSEAETLHRRLLNLCLSQYEKRHPRVLDAMQGLALAVLSLGRYQEAENLGRAALAGRSKHAGISPMGVLYNMADLGDILSGRNQLREAEVHYRETLLLARRILPPHHRDLARFSGQLGVCLLRKGDAVEAEPLLLESFRRFQHAFGASHPKTQKAIALMVRVSSVRDKMAAATRYEAMLSPR